MVSRASLRSLGRALGRGFRCALLATLLGGAAPVWAAELHGHRGARGLAPENTLPGFATALEVGVDVLELDVGMTADGVPVIGHDRRLKPDLVRRDGHWLEGDGPLLAELDYAALSAYDVGRIRPGSRYAGRFPEQRGLDGIAMPRLAELFDLVVRAGADHVGFNIEIKTSPLAPAETRPPNEILAAVLDQVRAHDLEPRVIVQAFDWATLELARRRAPQLATAHLTVSQDWFDNLERGQPGASPWTGGVDIDDFGAGPDATPRAVAAAGGRIWSPFFRELSAAALAEAHRLGLRVVVWTVNQPADMEALLDLGVDGIISDRPDLLRRVMAARGLPLPPAVRVPR